MKNKVFLNCVLIISAILILIGYKLVICFLAKSSTDFDLVCSLNWKDGLMLTFSYLTYIILDIFLNKLPREVYLRWLLIILIYMILYGALAEPYMISSFMQNKKQNSFLHLFILLFLMDNTFLILTKSRRNKNDNGSQQKYLQ
jgi:hypothetical protein